MKEIWKTIDSFPNYMISNLGNVKRKEYDAICNGRANHKTRHYKEAIVRQCSMYKGSPYRMVTLSNSDNGRKVGRFLVHRLVATYFIPNPDNKPVVDHIDRNPKNNRVDNLRWVTQSENVQNTDVEERSRKLSVAGMGKKRHCCPCKCITTGEVFDCVKDALKHFNLTRRIDYLKVLKCCKGEIASHRGLEFEYAV